MPYAIVNYMIRKHTQAGFTMAEMVVVVSIIIIISISGLWVYNNLFERSNAAEIAADFEDIQSAWKLYLLDSNETPPLQAIFGTNNPDAPCHNEPIFFDTDLFTNVSGTGNWSGPYLTHEPIDPWSRRYTFDNDGDTYVFDTSDPGYGIQKGINAQLQWCPGQDAEMTRYLRLAPLIDEMLDKGDGAGAGAFRWDPNPDGGYFFLLTAN